jgi:hypothetical protein
MPWNKYVWTEIDLTAAKSFHPRHASISLHGTGARLLRIPPPLSSPPVTSATRAIPDSEKKLWHYINLKLAALG